MANSRKLSGRCVAGIRTDGAGWIRPVSQSPDGTLYWPQYLLSDGTEPRILDVIEIELVCPRPAVHQPENWISDATRWRLVSRPAPPEKLRLLARQIVEGPILLHSDTDRVPFAAFSTTPATASLALVAPKEISWKITYSIRGRRQTRAVFTLGDSAFYDLAVTDPEWESRLRHLTLGTYSPQQIGVDAGMETVLTVSLGEPFEDGNCYKLVSGVLILPRTWREE